MEYVEETADERMQAWCIHCGKGIAGTKANEDHAPSRVLLDKPHPPRLPAMTVCQPCNTSFSVDEEYLAAFLGAVLAGTTDPSKQRVERAARILGSNAALVRRIEQAKQTYQTQGGDERIVWTPEEARVRNVVVKNAKGHVFYELSEPMVEAPSHVWFRPLESLTTSEREAFEEVSWPNTWPEVGSRMMTRLLRGDDLAGSWIVVQEGVYRYGVTQRDGGMLVRIVMREYLGAEVFWGK
ncbi:hypothetical protein [Mesorhizobium sp.]|uniref:hypothetical protein n=1 Tax=Mesorhizobium sp. TaxID=1871066 RepID=UPI0011F497E6|nr:hypothetical protein [Mesorhizobium sp.]TIQ79916.1 MAG: hypothetical protein E5X39_13075 [Mesorhizobium sp.]